MIGKARATVRLLTPPASWLWSTITSGELLSRQPNNIEFCWWEDHVARCDGAA